jgi:uncharacterized protein with PIN domain
MPWKHISDHDLERYCLGIVATESELAPLEEHILACPSCAGRAEEIQDDVAHALVRAVSRLVSTPWWVTDTCATSSTIKYRRGPAAPIVM